MEITIEQLTAALTAAGSAGSLVVYVHQSKEASKRAFARIEALERILIAQGFMEVPEATQSGSDGRGVRRPRNLPRD